MQTNSTCVHMKNCSPNTAREVRIGALRSFVAMISNLSAAGSTYVKPLSLGEYSRSPASTCDAENVAFRILLPVSECHSNRRGLRGNLIRILEKSPIYEDS